MSARAAGKQEQMTIKLTRKSAFTLVEIMIVVAIIGLLAAIAIPNFVKSRNTSQRNACINNMRLIDGIIQQWALETRKGSGQPIEPDQIPFYLRGENVPHCPAGGDYLYGATIGTIPAVTCPNVLAFPLHVFQ